MDPALSPAVPGGGPAWELCEMKCDMQLIPLGLAPSYLPCRDVGKKGRLPGCVGWSYQLGGQPAASGELLSEVTVAHPGCVGA